MRRVGGSDHGTGPRPRGRIVATSAAVADVAFIGPVLSTHGGTESWHADLLPRLQRLGLTIAGYGASEGTGGDSAAARRLRAAGIAVAIGPDAPARLAAAARVVVSWGLAEPRAFVPAGCKLVVVSHGDAASKWTVSVMGRSAPQADRVVAVDRVAVEPVPASHRETTRVIRNGIDPARLAPSADRDTLRARLGWTGRTLLVCSRMSTEKRVEVAVRALKDLPADWRLVVAGDGVERLRYQAVAAFNGLADRCDWLGVRHDVADLYHAADALIAPGLSEGFGLSLAEAMLCGCPVVAPRVGFLVERPDLAELVAGDAPPEAWAAAVLRATARERVETARAAVATLTDPDAWAASWAALIRELLPTPALSMGPGSILHRWLDQADGLLGPARWLLRAVAPAFAASLSLRAGEGCGCVTRAAQMDAWGPDGCEANLDTIATWLVTSARERSLPCSTRLAKWVIRRAIVASRAGGASAVWSLAG
jgi:glycosyltransferase involved in cell wall biosynthesis